MVWFGQNSEAEFNTVSESVSESVTKVGIELLGQLKMALPNEITHRSITMISSRDARAPHDSAWHDMTWQNKEIKHLLCPGMTGTSQT